MNTFLTVILTFLAWYCTGFVLVTIPTAVFDMVCDTDFVNSKMAIEATAIVSAIAAIVTLVGLLTF